MLLCDLCCGSQASVEAIHLPGFSSKSQQGKLHSTDHLDRVQQFKLLLCASQQSNFTLSFVGLNMKIYVFGMSSIAAFLSIPDTPGLLQIPAPFTFAASGLHRIMMVTLSPFIL